MPQAVSVGECMLELVRQGGTGAGGMGQWAMQIGGDAFNVAVYLARGGVDTAFLTALGEDSFSRHMRGAWQAEGLDTSLVATVPDRVPGLYAIETDAAGERHFTYWRDRSAARALFDQPDIAALLGRAAQTKLLYLSGITLSLFDAGGRAELRALAAKVREQGGAVAFDSNYRARLWPSPEVARQAIEDFAPLVDIALPTLTDEQALFGDRDAGAAAARWRGRGAGTVAVKLGMDGALLATGDQQQVIGTPPQAQPHDTTGAGDSFNGAFLAAWLQGRSAAEAVMAGHRLAGAVIRHSGAIIPRSAMPDMAA